MIQKVSFLNSKGLKLAGVLHLPESEGKFPAVLLLHGFASSKEPLQIASLAERLAENGIIALRFDTSGIGESEGTIEKDYRFSNQVADAESVYEYLRNLDAVGSARVGIFGHSLGGTAAIIFAARHEDVKSVSVVSTPTSYVRPESAEKIEEWRNSGYLERVNERWGLLRIPYAFIEDAKKWNALDFVGQIHVPLLMIAGTEDKNVSKENSKELFDLAPEPKEWFEVEGMDHFYRKYPNLFEKVNNKVLDFFQRTLSAQT